MRPRSNSATIVLCSRDLVARTGTDPLTKWLLLVTSGEPFQSESTWDAVTLSRLTTYTTGLGDFLTVWRSYMESEERLLHDLRDDLGDVRFGKDQRLGRGRDKAHRHDPGSAPTSLQPGSSSTS